MPLDSIPRDKLYALINRRLAKYEADERHAILRQKAIKDHHKRLEMREAEFIAHGKILAATEILEDVAGFGRQV